MTPNEEVLLSPAAAPGSQPLPQRLWKKGAQKGKAKRSWALARGNPIKMHCR